MLKFKHSILISLISVIGIFISACDIVNDSASQRPEPPQTVAPVESKGIALSYIMHDTPKLGQVEFYAKDGSDSYTWTVTNSNNEDVTLENNTGRSYTHNFTAAGQYTISVTAGEQIRTGIINIPESQEFAIDLGQNHTLISDINAGNLYVYGNNDKGQLCTAETTTSIKTPAILSSYKNVDSVAAGAVHTIFADGPNPYVCGDNTEGLLGIGQDNAIHYTPTLLESNNTGTEGTKLIVTAGDRISGMATLTPRGSSYNANFYRWGWKGYDADGTTNLYDYTPQSTMTGNASAGFAVGQNQIAVAGKDHIIVALTASSTFFQAGYNDRWQTGGSIKDKNALYGGKNPDEYEEGEGIGFNTSTQQVYYPYGSSANQGMYMTNLANSKAAAGNKFSIVKLGTEAIYVWGDNTKGQVGLDDLNGDGMIRRGAPLFVFTDNALEEKYKGEMATYVEYNPIKDNIKEIAAGASHGLAVSESGKLYGWGDNTKGQIGGLSNTHSNATNNKVFEIDNPNGVEAGYQKVWAGGDRTIALAGDNNLYTWGDNANGILGVLNTESDVVETPVKIMFDIRPADTAAIQ